MLLRLVLHRWIRRTTDVTLLVYKGMKLTFEVPEWNDLIPGAYVKLHDGTKFWGLVYLCPGCGKTFSITTGPEHPKWGIDFDKLTAHPSIRHAKEKGGCGWHGYLKEGVLEGKIE